MYIVINIWMFLIISNNKVNVRVWPLPSKVNTGFNWAET